jgi:hypothetical protein
MKRLNATLAVGASLLLSLASSVFAADTLQLVPFEYDPENACDVRATWQDGALSLQKNCATATNAAAGVEIISSLEGGSISALTSLSFDVQNGGHCGAGAPRFNVVVDGSTYFLGCAGGSITDNGDGWSTVSFGTTQFAAAGIPTTGTLEDVYIVFDEGSDTPTGGTIGTAGKVVIDNITLNDATVGDAAQPTDMNQCKKGGWTEFQDPEFKNQGQCVSFVVSNRGGNHDDGDDGEGEGSGDDGANTGSGNGGGNGSGSGNGNSGNGGNGGNGGGNGNGNNGNGNGGSSGGTPPSHGGGKKP